MVANMWETSPHDGLFHFTPCIPMAVIQQNSQTAENFMIRHRVSYLKLRFCVKDGQVVHQILSLTSLGTELNYISQPPLQLGKDT